MACQLVLPLFFISIMARYKTHAYVLVYANGKSEDSIKFKKGFYKLCTTTRLTSSESLGKMKSRRGK